jgi:aerobic-type carbon monoxide dehydrogenase small subunit (CoxS/CutS family)
MPLLWVLRDLVGLTGTKFGCGIAQCGACTVNLDGEAVRSCVLPIAAIGNRKITTIEAIGATPAGKKVQNAWRDLDVVQCGYCQSGQVMAAAALIASNPMEPVDCTAHVRPDGCEIWVGTQVPTRVVDTVRKITGLPAEKIVVHNHLLGGGFGRRLEIDMVSQAAKIARQVNAPVKVMWAREEDIRHDMYRPYYYDRISAGLDANGKPVAWQHRIVGSSILARFAPSAVKNGVDPDAVEVAADLPYDLPNQFIDYVRQEPRHVPTSRAVCSQPS